MGKKVVVLGAGMVGRAIALDLSLNYDVLSVDKDEAALQLMPAQPGLTTRSADLSQAAVIQELVSDADLVIGAVPGFMGYQTLKTVIAAGRNIVDISFFTEDPFKLDDLARAQGVIAVIDAGVAPGMSNIILGYHTAMMQVKNFTCFVGGLPQERSWPYEYKAPFSPIDVIEEYKRPARLVINGLVVERPALSDAELLDFPGVGTLEAFNTDGLRSLIKTQSVPNMKEQTLRYPGHIERMHMLLKSGFFDKQPVDINGQFIRPIDLTTRLLFPLWQLEPKEPEFTLMRIKLDGQENGKKVSYQYDLLDRYDPVTETSSMARTTGYTCTGIARLVLSGHYTKAGISPPEFIGASDPCFEFLQQHLEQRQIHYRVEKSEK